MPFAASYASLLTSRWAINAYLGISTQLARNLLHTMGRRDAGGWEVMTRSHGRDGKVGLSRRRSRHSASERGSAEMAWRFVPGNGRAAGGLCDRLRDEFRGGLEVCRDSLRASIKRQKTSQGSEHVDPWNSRRLSLFHERVRRVEPDFSPLLGFREGSSLVPKAGHATPAAALQPERLEPGGGPH